MVTACLGASLSSTLKTLLFVGPFLGLHASGYTIGGSNVLSVITWSPPHHPKATKHQLPKLCLGDKEESLEQTQVCVLFVGNPFLPPYLGTKKLLSQRE